MTEVHYALCDSLFDYYETVQEHYGVQNLRCIGLNRLTTPREYQTWLRHILRYIYLFRKLR